MPRRDLQPADRPRALPAWPSGRHPVLPGPDHPTPVQSPRANPQGPSRTMERVNTTLPSCEGRTSRPARVRAELPPFARQRLGSIEIRTALTAGHSNARGGRGAAERRRSARGRATRRSASRLLDAALAGSWPRPASGGAPLSLHGGRDQERVAPHALPARPDVALSGRAAPVVARRSRRTEDRER